MRCPSSVAVLGGWTANLAGASRLQSLRPVRRVAKLGSLGFMKTSNVNCPFCGGILEPVNVIPDVKVGLLSSLFGYSIGTKARLSWSGPGENYAPTGIP